MKGYENTITIGFNRKPDGSYVFSLQTSVKGKETIEVRGQGINSTAARQRLAGEVAASVELAEAVQGESAKEVDEVIRRAMEASRS